MKKLGLALAIVLTVAACGGDSGTTTTAAPGGAVSLSITLEDYLYAPESLTVAPGASVSLSADNVGGTDHTWTLLTAGEEVTTAVDLDPARVVAEVYVAASSGASGLFTAPSQGGIYQVICTVAGHMELGMVGSLVVSG